MGACLILAPAIIAGWPAITAAVAGAAAAMGLSMASETEEIVEDSNAEPTRVALSPATQTCSPPLLHASLHDSAIRRWR